MLCVVAAIVMLCATGSAEAQTRRPIDSKHPLWLIHVDVWNKADPQKIIDLIPSDIKPYVCMNLSLSCQYDTEKNVYKMPQNAVKTYKSWASVCQRNGLWFTCQPASGGHTHIQDDDIETFEYFFKHYRNFLGWNYAEQFWGFDEPNDKSSSTQLSRIALFAKLVEMSHEYGGFLTISFCGNIYSHGLNPVGMMKRNDDLRAACEKYPEAILWLYKYTTSACFHNNESVTFAPFLSGLAKNYGVRYDNCGWNGALDEILGKNHGKQYPAAAGIGTVMEQTGINGGAVWDGPELIWTEDFQNLSDSNVDGYTRRNWGRFKNFDYAWIDLFRKVIDGTLYIPTRQEVIERTQIVVVNDMASGNDEERYAAWGDLYDGLYKVDDPFNNGNGQWGNNHMYMKGSGRYATIAVTNKLADDLARQIPVVVKKSERNNRWSTIEAKVAEFNQYYPQVSEGDMYVARIKNQLVTYNPYSYLNTKTTAEASINLEYNTCDKLELEYNTLSSGIVRETKEGISIYLNNYRSDITTKGTDYITITGAKSKPSYAMKKHTGISAEIGETWLEASHIYTLSVNHNGPVDITIKCEGNATDRRTDEIETQALSNDKPKQPSKDFGEVTYEAEDMDYKGISANIVSPYDQRPGVRGHAGNGFIETGTSTSGSLKCFAKVNISGTYKLKVRYCNNSKAGELTLDINGKTQKVAVEVTGTNKWKYATAEASLNEDNVVLINNTGGINMMIDNMTIAPADSKDEKYEVNIRQVEHCTTTSDKARAAEGETVQLICITESVYDLKGWEIIHGNIEISSTNTFVMPDDNVTVRPIIEDTRAVYELNFTEVGNGTLPAGWETTQGGNEVHSYPNSYGAGARTFSGFNGYQGRALYWREVCAEYGKQSNYRMHLNQGRYKLTYAMAAWKGTPEYTANIVDLNGISSKKVVTSESHTARPNADGSTSADISQTEMMELEFDINQGGYYAIRFESAGGFSEYLLVACKLVQLSGNAIEDITIEDSHVIEIYGLDGRKRQNIERGINILKMSDGKTRKVMIK